MVEELEAKAAKLDMIEWAVKNEIGFIFDPEYCEFSACLNEEDLKNLEQLYKEREQSE